MQTLCLFFTLILLAHGVHPIPSNSTTDHVLNSIVQDDTNADRVRPCSLTFLDRGQDETIRAIEKRIADFTFLPVENGEGLQVIHYEVGHKYPLHYDLGDDYHTKNGDQRMATVLMYLADAEDGGETAFPSAVGKYNDVRWQFEYSECNKSRLFAKPKKGDALLLWNVKPDGTPEYSSLYAECPVIKGNKWTATKWIHAKEYYKE